MESQRQDDLSNEDIPSDFFDDFSKDEFMEGLSVIDSWDVKEGVTRRSSKSRFNSATVYGVRDLRELIRDGKDDEFDLTHHEKHNSRMKKSRYDCEAPYERHYDNQRDSSCSRMENYIKPGSRRDLRKTNEAIKKDKQVKVKEYLSKHLDSIDDLKPPGAELDDFLNEPSTVSKRKNKSRSPQVQYTRYPSKEPKYRMSPKRRYQHRDRHSPHWSPREHYYHNPNHHSIPYSPPSKVRYHSPGWRPQRHYSPHFSSRRSSRPHHSPRRSPSQHSPIQYSRHHSRTPTRYEKHSPIRHKDTFLYPNESPHTSPQTSGTSVAYQNDKAAFYRNSTATEYPPSAPGYPYDQTTQYASAPYDYQAQADSNQGLIQSLPSILNSAPQMVPPPCETITTDDPGSTLCNTPATQEKPYDALAKLFIEGKISREDYLKLTPNKGTYVDKPVDTQMKAKVLNRCLEALGKLSKLELPNCLLINNDLIGEDRKSITPKYCSPLKRQAIVDFTFTQTSGNDADQQNRQVIDSIISALGLTNIVSSLKRLNQKETKDAAVQTTKPSCEVCMIRDSTKTFDAETTTDLEHFTSTVHTQVVEQDLMSSKSVFNPSGSGTDNEPISIAHLTPAQLVSQLAARAKTLKQSNATQHNQYNRNHGKYGGGGSKDNKFYRHPYR